MEFGPIIRALRHNKVRFGLIAVEVALTLAIVTNCLAMLFEHRDAYLEPTGLDEENIIAITTWPFGKSFDDESFIDLVRERDLRMLRAIPGVHGATAINFFPLGGSGTSWNRRPVVPNMEQMEQYDTPQYTVSDGALQTMGVELIEGRDFSEADFLNLPKEGESGEMNIIVTEAYGRLLFPNGDAPGKAIGDPDYPVHEIIVGIVRRLDNPWPWSDTRDHCIILPGKPGGVHQMQYLVRTQPGAMNTVFAQIDESIRKVNNERTVRVRTLTEVKQKAFGYGLLMTKLFGGIIVMLVIVTLLGIVGLTSFLVTDRTRQIGIRRALGATKGNILRYFLVETWIVSGMGLVLGVILAPLLNALLAHVAQAPKLSPSMLLIGALTLWGVALSAALLPALRAINIAPDVATRG